MEHRVGLSANLEIQCYEGMVIQGAIMQLDNPEFSGLQDKVSEERMKSEMRVSTLSACCKTPYLPFD